MTKYKRAILNALIDKYERSKTFIGSNQNNQSFSKSIVELFPKYADDSEFEVFTDVNNAISELENDGFILSKKRKNGVYTKVSLNISNIQNAYSALKRTPKAEINQSLEGILNQFIDKNELLNRFCSDQLKRISENKSVRGFDGDLEELYNILKSLEEVFNVEEETYIRDFSIRVFKDSKKFETIKTKVVNILFDYGDFPEKEDILSDLNIIRNPGHVYFKGNGLLIINGNTINVGGIPGDVAISSSVLKAIDDIKVFSSNVITIENLTTFNRFNEEEYFVIYLGGYHNRDRREFIKKLYERNDEKQYYHFGDIDAGGFYILDHLRRKTGVNFIPYKMDVATLQENVGFTKLLNENDRIRLERLREGEHKEVVSFMLENNCKLEQESMD